jgi:hypothetical protein
VTGCRVAVTVDDRAGEAYISLAVGAAPEVRHSVALDALEAADTVPALDSLVLDFDHFGRLVGLRVRGAADSVLPATLLDAARAAELEDGARS